MAENLGVSLLSQKKIIPRSVLTAPTPGFPFCSPDHMGITQAPGHAEQSREQHLTMTLLFCFSGTGFFL